MGYYQRLKAEELEGLKDEFVKFLVLNGIDADSWTKIQQEDSDKANGIIEQFSEVVFESSLKLAQFVFMVEPKAVRSFQLGAETITFFGLQFIGSDESFDFNKVDDLATILVERSQDFNIQHATKAYSKKREHEIYDMIQAGCKISTGQVFKLLSMYWADIKAAQN